MMQINIVEMSFWFMLVEGLFLNPEKERSDIMLASFDRDIDRRRRIVNFSFERGHGHFLRRRQQQLQGDRNPISPRVVFFLMKTDLLLVLKIFSRRVINL